MYNDNVALACPLNRQHSTHSNADSQLGQIILTFKSKLRSELYWEMLKKEKKKEAMFGASCFSFTLL